MQPYRIKSRSDERRIVRIGDDRHRVLLAMVSLLLVGFTLASVLGWYFFGGRIHGSVLAPAVVGAALLVKRRATSVEYVRDPDELRVEFRSILRRRQVRVPVGEITGLTVTSPSAKQSGAEYELRLLMKGGHSVRLLGASRAARIEPARAAVSSFLLEQGLLRGDLEAGSAARLRLAEASDADATPHETGADAPERHGARP